MRLHLHGVHLPHNKHTAQLSAVRIPVPGTVVIPLQMHIGAPAKPTVRIGDPVKVGQMIGEAGGFVSAPVHSSVSGTVKKIGEMTGANGRKMQTVIIETDGLQTPFEEIRKPEIHNLQDFLNAVRESGIVGLGGAGFPTSVKLTLKDPSVLKAVIINCAECEPYITSDTRTLLDRSEDVMEGARLIREYLNPPRIIFGIENNKPECIALYRELTAGEAGMEVQALKFMYPQGGEKVLIYNTIGGIVPEGGLPIDAGAVVLNCTTLASIAAYVRTGMPLVEKCITVDGSAVRECLPGANCGACGYSGCDGYAHAILEEGAKPNLCVPGAGTTAAALSRVLGIDVEDAEKKLAVVRCNGVCSATAPKYVYNGIRTCAAAKQLFGGTGSCSYGCLGFGDCMSLCPNGAISLNLGIAHIDPAKCVGCGLCAKTCPQKLIDIVPADIPFEVLCSNADPGAATRQACKNGCIGCKRCEKACPSGAISVVNNHAWINHELCTGCGQCAEVCPSKCIAKPF